METRDRDRFDDVLDKALRHYGNVEPRIGLENRILTNMQVVGKRAHSGDGWVLAGAIATALVIAIGGGIWHQDLIPKQNVPVSLVPKNALRPASSATVPRTPEIAKTRTSRQRRRTVAASTAASTHSPKLDQFPSPFPLSQQELLFASYAEHFPKEALVLVQEQRDFEEEIRLAERDARQLPQVYIEKGE